MDIPSGINKDQVEQAKGHLFEVTEQLRKEGIGNLEMALAYLEVSAQIMVLSTNTLYAIHVITAAASDICIHGPTFEAVKNALLNDEPEEPDSGPSGLLH